MSSIDAVDIGFCDQIRLIPGKILDWVSKTAEKVLDVYLSKVFYMGHRNLSPQLMASRTQALIASKGAYPLACQNIDALHIPSTSAQKTGNVVVIALNNLYQDHHPRNYEHYLKNGADVVLWNTTALTIAQYQRDLTSVLRTLKQDKPDLKIAIKTYCSSAEPAIAAAATLNDENISLIVDRGHGDSYKLARSFTIFAKLPCIQKAIQNKFSCQGMQKINAIPGKIVFVSPAGTSDQVMTYNRTKNLTRDLYHERQRLGKVGDSLILLENSDHWTPWNASVHNKINTFLCERGILAQGFTPVSDALFPQFPAPSFFKRVIVPFLTKSWF